MSNKTEENKPEKSIIISLQDFNNAIHQEITFLNNKNIDYQIEFINSLSPKRATILIEESELSQITSKMFVEQFGYKVIFDAGHQAIGIFKNIVLNG